MKKRFFTLLVTVCLLCGLCVPSALAVRTDETGVEQTIRALGIMVGDTCGQYESHAATSPAPSSPKCWWMASSYKDSIGEGGSGYSLFSDVKSSYWASEYIKIAVEQRLDRGLHRRDVPPLSDHHPGAGLHHGRAADAGL
jgi:hypothetical protein